MSAVSNYPARTLCAVGFALASCIATPASAFSTTVGGTNLGVIPDGNASGRNVVFQVAGLPSRVESLSISLSLTHPYIGDLQVQLISPGGLAHLVLFSNAGYRRNLAAGSASNLGGDYRFIDTAQVDLWSVLDTSGGSAVLPSGDYRATTAGRPGLSDAGGCSTQLNRAFGGLSGAQLNGQWTLKLVDVSSSDVGSISAASISVQLADGLFAGGFEDVEIPAPAAVSDVPGRCKETAFDFTGTGLSSYALVRPASNASNAPMQWTVQDNNGGANGAIQMFEFGTASDMLLEGDFDGDGTRDPTAWTPATGVFRVRRSSRPNDVPLQMKLGGAGDRVRIGGDFDGDNVTDAIAYSPASTQGVPSRTRIVLSRTGQLRTFAAGEKNSFVSGGLDFDGDHRADLVMRVSDGAGHGRYDVRNASGQLIDTFITGPDTAVFTIGNHTGDALSDVTVLNGQAGQGTWTTRDTNTGVVQPTITFGALGSDHFLTGDYDGDGLDDYAMWHAPEAPAATGFVVRKSTDPTAVPVLVPMGEREDVPPAGWRVN